MFSDMLEDAARSCESEVDMVEAKMPAITTPATSAAIIPFLLRRLAISIIIVSDLAATPSDSTPSKNPPSAPFSIIP